MESTCSFIRGTVAQTEVTEITQKNAMTCIIQVRLDDLIVPSGLKSYELQI